MSLRRSHASSPRYCQLVPPTAPSLLRKSSNPASVVNVNVYPSGFLHKREPQVSSQTAHLRRPLSFPELDEFSMHFPYTVKKILVNLR